MERNWNQIDLQNLKISLSIKTYILEFKNKVTPQYFFLQSMTQNLLENSMVPLEGLVSTDNDPLEEVTMA